jgi:hypothetical protein
MTLQHMASRAHASFQFGEVGSIISRGDATTVLKLLAWPMWPRPPPTPRGCGHRRCYSRWRAAPSPMCPSRCARFGAPSFTAVQSVGLHGSKWFERVLTCSDVTRRASSR